MWFRWSDRFVKPVTHSRRGSKNSYTTHQDTIGPISTMGYHNDRIAIQSGNLFPGGNGIRVPVHRDMEGRGLCVPSNGMGILQNRQGGRGSHGTNHPVVEIGQEKPVVQRVEAWRWQE